MKQFLFWAGVFMLLILSVGLLGRCLTSAGEPVKQPTLQEQEQKVQGLINQANAQQILVNEAVRSLVSKQNAFDQIAEQLRKEAVLLNKLRNPIPAPAPAKPSTTK